MNAEYCSYGGHGSIFEDQAVSHLDTQSKLDLVPGIDERITKEQVLLRRLLRLAQGVPLRFGCLCKGIYCTNLT